MSIGDLSTYYQDNKLTYTGERTLQQGGVIAGVASLVAASVIYFFLFTNTTWGFGAVLGGAFGGGAALVGGSFLIIGCVGKLCKQKEPAHETPFEASIRYLFTKASSVGAILGSAAGGAVTLIGGTGSLIRSAIGLCTQEKPAQVPILRADLNFSDLYEESL